MSVIGPGEPNEPQLHALCCRVLDCRGTNSHDSHREPLRRTCLWNRGAIIVQTILSWLHNVAKYKMQSERQFLGGPNTRSLEKMFDARSNLLNSKTPPYAQET